jgi:hypothetical protein
MNFERHPRVYFIVDSPFGSHLNTSGWNNFWVEVEGHWQLERIIAKLERKLVESFSGRDGHVFLAKSAQMPIRQLHFKVKSDRLQNFKFNLLQHVAIVALSLFG